LNASTPWSVLSQCWLHIPLPDYRESPEHHTYEGSSLEDLPPIPIGLDEECEWLMRHGAIHGHRALNKYERDIQPALVEKLALGAKIQLPRSFRRFMSSPDLQSRVRSCTDCYLDPGERIVETIGSIPGHLVHFLRIPSRALTGIYTFFPAANPPCWYRRIYIATKLRTRIGSRIRLAGLSASI
jgi:hypothetical protein